jgi:cytochrome c553
MTFCRRTPSELPQVNPRWVFASQVRCSVVAGQPFIVYARLLSASLKHSDNIWGKLSLAPANRSVRFLTCAIVSCYIASSAMAQNSSPGAVEQSKVLKSCQSCHGPDGDSKVTTTPRLNGQQAGYIVDRLKKLSDVSQSNPHTKLAMFKELSVESGSSRLAIANYFASRPPTSPEPGARSAEGKLIFEKGSATENVIACTLCHGPKGEGHDATPRIAGQHADYLKSQLRLFNMKFREHVLMNPNTKTMTENTMDALTSYLAND